MQNPVKHLRWSFLWKYLTVDSNYQSLQELHLRCFTKFWQGFNMPLGLRDLFASVFVWNSLNILTVTVKTVKWKLLIQYNQPGNRLTVFRSTRGVLWKKVVLKNFTKFTGKHLCRSLFLQTFIKNEDYAKLCEIVNTCFVEHLRTAASVFFFIY